MPSPSTVELTAQLVDTLHPRPDVRALTERAVGRFADQLDDDDALEAVVNAAQHPTGIGTHELAQRAACSERQIRYWTDEGYLIALPGPRGSGYRATYATQAISKARIMGALVRLFEMGPKAASSVADELMAGGTAKVGGFTLTRSRFDR